MAYIGFTTELMEPMTKEGIRGAIRHIHSRILEDKPIKGMYRDYLLEALDKIANGSNPDTAFKFRSHQTNPSLEPKIFEAMQKIYHRNTEGAKITDIIDEVAKELGFGYEMLKAKWYKNKCAWKKAWDQHYEDQRQFQDEMRQKALDDAHEP